MTARGRVVREPIDSHLLRDNPLGDPHERTLLCYLPPSYDSSPERRYPVLYLLPAFAGLAEGALSRKAWRESIDQRMDRLIGTGACAEAIVVVPDAFTRLGGSQYIDSAATGPYARHLVEEVVPTVDARLRTRGDGHRGAFGRSSGGYGALVLAMHHPGVFSAVASHSGDMYFEYCYGSDLPAAAAVLSREESCEAFVRRVESGVSLGRHDFAALNVLAMAACYSPEPGSPDLGVALPFDRRTLELLPEVWSRWLEHDPVRMLDGHADALRQLRLLYLDCGDRDEVWLHLGARILTRRLAEAGIEHHYEEFSGGHFDGDRRYDHSLPSLVAALG